MNKSTGATLAIFGGGSLVLNLVGYEFVLLMPLDFFGEGVGWTVRIGLLLGGLAILALGRDPETEEYTVEESEPPPLGAPRLESAVASQQFERDADGKAKILTCAQHNLRYDPSQHKGCVVCRRG